MLIRARSLSQRCEALVRPTWQASHEAAEVPRRKEPWRPAAHSRQSVLAFAAAHEPTRQSVQTVVPGASMERAMLA